MNSRPELGEALLQAVAANQYKIVESLLKVGATTQSSTAVEDNTPLHLAVKNNNSGITALLLQYKASKVAKNKMGKTPIGMAADLNYWLCVYEFVSYVTDEKDEAHYGYALLTAVMNDENRLVEGLLEAKANLSWITTSNNNTLLHWAVDRNNTQITSSLLKHKANIFKKNKEGHMPIVMAAMNEHWGCVRQFSDYPTDNKDEAGYGSALVLAAKADERQIVSVLLSAGANSGSYNTILNENSALHWAVENHNAEMTEILLKHKADPFKKNKAGQSAIVMAAETRSWKCLNVFIEKHKPEVKDKTEYSRALIQSVIADEYHAVEGLLNVGASTTFYSIDTGNSTLHWAVHNNNQHMLRLLLKHSANRLAKNKRGQTPIAMAAEKEYWKCVSEFLLYPSDKKDEAQYGSALVLAAGADQSQLVVNLLKVGVSNHWETQSDKNTALHLAAKNNNSSMVMALLKSSNRFAKNNEGKTPIMIAAEAGYWKCVEEFAKYKTNSQDEPQYSFALLKAAKANEYNIVFLLLESGAGTALRSENDENTALHWAAQHSNPNLVNMLISYKADTNALNKAKKIPFNLALENKSWETAFAFTTLALTTRTVEKEKKYDNNLFIINIVSQVSRAPVQQETIDLFKLDKSKNKDILLALIFSIHNPIIKQKALWQSLDPKTGLGQLFYLASFFSTPSSASGHLKQVVKELKVLISDNLNIDEDIKKALNQNSTLLKLFPSLSIKESTETIHSEKTSTIAMMEKLSIANTGTYFESPDEKKEEVEVFSPVLTIHDEKPSPRQYLKI